MGGDNSTQDIKSATQNLGTQTQRVTQAMQFTNGDMERARKMASGDYQDVYVIKGKVHSDISREYGIFMLFLTSEGMRLKNFQAAMSRSPYVYDKKITSKWTQLYKELAKFYSDSDYDSEITSNFINNFKKVMQSPVIAGLIKAADEKNTQEITETIEKVVRNNLQMSKAKVQVDYDLSDSLTVADQDIKDTTLPVQNESKSKTQEEPDYPPEIKNILSSALQGASVLSPTRGKEITKIQIGDKIKIHITDTSERGRNIIRIMDAETEDGTLKPVPARVRYIQKKKNGNWLVIVDLGENIFIWTEEEADNVRLALAEPPGGSQSVTASQDNKTKYLPLLLGLGLGLFILVFIVLIFLFL